MNSKQCLKMFREIKDAAFATVDMDGRPQVRIIDVMYVEDEKLYFLTARGKHFYSELMATGNVAVTAMTKNYEMLRLNGKVTKVEDNDKWLDIIFKNNPSMNDVYPGTSRNILQVFSIESGEIEYFNLQKTPIFREIYSIGGYKAVKKGYVITDSCVMCGICSSVCPQKCIIKTDGAYCITQENCLHCGLCYESCPANAIAKRG